MKALIVSADGFEDSELFAPYYRLLEEEIITEIASQYAGHIVGKHGYQVPVTQTLKQTQAAAYDLLILPGGKAPARLRQDENLLSLVRQFFTDNKPVAAICHGPQILVSAGVLKGRTATCYRTVAQEPVDAGCNYLDQEVVVDNNLITSRKPSDLPAFMREIMKKCRR